MEKIERLPAHGVTVIISAILKSVTSIFYNVKLLYSAYLSQILWYKWYLFLGANVLKNYFGHFYV